MTQEGVISWERGQDARARFRVGRARCLRSQEAGASHALSVTLDL